MDSINSMPCYRVHGQNFNGPIRVNIKAPAALQSAEATKCCAALLLSNHFICCSRASVLLLLCPASL